MKEALKLALEALETLHDENMDYLVRNKLGGENNQCMVFARDVIKSIKRTLAQDQGADYERGFIDGMQKQMQSSVDKAVNVMSSTWVGLTDEEVIAASASATYMDDLDAWTFAKAIEQALKEKNT